MTRLRQQTKETEDLRQRIEVLEDIVTSEEYDLERRFPRLESEEQTPGQSVQVDR